MRHCLHASKVDIISYFCVDKLYTEFLLLLQLCAGDGLPAQICCQCVQQVNTSYSFKLQCETVDTTLRQLRDFHQKQVIALYAS